MKFLLMMTCTATQWESLGSWSPTELQAHMRFMIDFAERLRQSGELLLAEGLDVPKNATIVRAKDPRAPIVTDGPFAETKEFLAGFWLIQVASRERALAIAAAASVAPGPGGVPMQIPIEVRQVMSAPDVG
jgi:hypothetical protein